MLKTILFFIITSFICADKVEVTSTFMETKNIKKEVHFIGNAKIKKQDDWLHANRIIVYFDENNETKMYEALGAVTFEFKDENRFYKGSADSIKYYPVESNYILEGKAIVNDLVHKHHVVGDFITLNMLTGNVDVKGSKKKPVKFIFDIEEKK